MTKKILIKKFNSQTQNYVTLTYHCKEYSIEAGLITFWDDKYNQRLSYPIEAVIEIQEVA
jgi:hypothetical protein